MGKKEKFAVFYFRWWKQCFGFREGFRGLVIKLQIVDCKFQNEKAIVGAGYPLTKLVLESAKRGLMGLEWAAGIPGTLGGAIRGNAGAFGREMKDVVDKVKTLQIVNCRL